MAWEPGSPTVRWVHAGIQVVKEYPRPVRSACWVPSPPSIVVVEDPGRAATTNVLKNCTVYDIDGRERLQLTPPHLPPDEPRFGFIQCFPSSDGLVAVYATYHQGDLWAIADLITGELGPTNPFR
jgi:hypothetical protein